MYIYISYVRLLTASLDPVSSEVPVSVSNVVPTMKEDVLLVPNSGVYFWWFLFCVYSIEGCTYLLIRRIFLESVDY